MRLRPLPWMATRRRSSSVGGSMMKLVFFSTNFRRFKFDPASIPAASIFEISRQTVPPDFRNRRIHRCWKIVAG